MQKIKFTPFRWEFAHTRNGGNFTFYRATARDRAEAERRRGCMACSFPEEGDRFKFCVNTKTDIRLIDSY